MSKFDGNLSLGDVGPKVAELRAKLTALGHMRKKPNRSGQKDDRFDFGLQAALLSYQAYHNLETSGVYSTAVDTDLSEARCGIPDLEENDQIGSYETHGGKWERSNLRYSFGKPCSTLSQDEVEQALAEAFSVWSRVIPVTFTKVASGGEMIISFEKKHHGDEYPFEGGGTVLAHAFYPSRGSKLAGDIHFDDDETWSFDGGRGFDLRSVAAHEIGHALGLKHSQIHSALMHSKYKFKRDLDYDDVAGMQQIYGVPS